MIVGMGWFEGRSTAELSREGGAQGGPGDRHRAPPSELRVQVRGWAPSISVVVQWPCSVLSACLSAG